MLRGRVSLVKVNVRQRRGKVVTMVNVHGIRSWAEQKSHPLWIEVRSFRAEMYETTHHGTDAQAILVKGLLADHRKEVTSSRQQIALSFDPGRWDAMDLVPQYFPGVGSPKNLEIAKGSGTRVRIGAVVLDLLADMDRKLSYDWVLEKPRSSG